MVGWIVLLMVVLLLLIVVVIASGASPRGATSSARARLDERLAAGDLTVDEHAERVVVLDERPSPRDAPWAIVAAGAVLLLMVGAVGWAAGGASMGWWGDDDRMMNDRMMNDHMGWGTLSGDADRPVAGAREVEVTATDVLFNPEVVDLRVGEPVNITLVNDGAVFHDLSIPELGFILAADPGQRVSGSLTVDEPGTYGFWCSVPGHARAGMRGTLRAVEP